MSIWRTEPCTASPTPRQARSGRWRRPGCWTPGSVWVRPRRRCRCAALAVRVTGVGGVPASGVSAVAVNLTVTRPAAGGYLAAYSNGKTRPVVSNLNFVKGLYRRESGRRAGRRGRKDRPLQRLQRIGATRRRHRGLLPETVQAEPVMSGARGAHNRERRDPAARLQAERSPSRRRGRTRTPRQIERASAVRIALQNGHPGVPVVGASTQLLWWRVAGRIWMRPIAVGRGTVGSALERDVVDRGIRGCMRASAASAWSALTDFCEPVKRSEKERLFVTAGHRRAGVRVRRSRRTISVLGMCAP